LLNGPKGVGKDTAANHMLRPGWVSASIMEDVKLDVLDLYGVDRDLIGLYESIKDQPADTFRGLSFRGAVIDYATKHRKDDPYYFAKKWAFYTKSLMSTDVPVVVVPDVRFFEEFIIACDLVGGRNVYLMRVYRPGHDFTGDVGGYIRTDMAVFGNAEVTINNDMDEEYFKLETSVFAQGFVARRGKK